MSRFQSVRNALYATLTAAVLAVPAVQAGETEELGQAINDTMRSSVNEMRESVHSELNHAVQRQVRQALGQYQPESEPRTMVAQVEGEQHEQLTAGQPQ